MFKKPAVFLLPISILLFFLFFLVKKPLPVSAIEMLNQEEFDKVVSPDNPLFTAADKDKFTTENILHTIQNMITGPTDSALRESDGQGAIIQTTSLIGFMIENPPVDTSEYLADLGSNLGFASPAYAQGLGWQALRPVLPVWKVFRNVAYMGFVIIFLAIGFMIMFRAKINPQTVISIQSALPKLIITLLLITFSYAIAGLMIDFIYILIYLLVGILGLNNLITNQSKVIDLLLQGSAFKVFYHPGEKGSIFLHGMSASLENLVQSIFGGEWFRSQGKETNLNILGSLLKLTLSISVFFSLIKLFFSLLLSYLGIVMNVVFAPFSILFNALPGSNAFMNWLKSLFSNIIVFPAVAGMFLLAAILIGPRSKDNYNPFYISDKVGFYPAAEKRQGVWIPPFLGVETGADTNIFQGLIALGIIMMLPKIIGKIKKMLKVEASGFGGVIMGSLLTGPKAMGAFGQQVVGGVQQITAMKSAKAQKEYFEQAARRTIPGRGAKK